MLSSLRDKHLDRWIRGYVQQRLSLLTHWRNGSHPTDLIFAICDHFEPLWAGESGKADHATGLRRVRKWHDHYGAMAEKHVDSSGNPPRHSFFFPFEEYHSEFFEYLDILAKRGYGEVEVHLHHDADNDASLTQTIQRGLDRYMDHGHLSRNDAGQPHYAFIHGNWALSNGRPDGRFCGVDNELAILHRTGCYADFTFPSCPDVTQSDQVNRIYWPTGSIARRRAYAYGRPARIGDRVVDRPLFITGPLGFGWHTLQKRPRLDYGAVTADDPASLSRIRTWINCGIHVEGRPEWRFVKVYIHGAPDHEADSFLGAGGHALHSALAEECKRREMRLHYVTAREMYNMAKAAMAGEVGNPSQFRNFEFPPPPVSTVR